MGLLRWIARGIGLTEQAAWKRAVPASSAAGKSVTVQSSMELPAFWACVRLISETGGTLPAILYERIADDNRARATGHSLYPLLHDQPNADHTAVEFWEGCFLSLCLYGNFYAEKKFLGARLVAILPLRADLMQVTRNASGALAYRYSGASGGKTFGEGEIFHVRGFGPAADMGLSPLSYARHSLGASMAVEETAAKMFANGVQPTGVLEMPSTLKPEQREMAQKNIVDPMSGTENAGKVFLLEAGMKFTPISLTPEDAQFLETRGWNVEEVCRWFRVPPFMIGHTSKTTSWPSSLEQQMISFRQFCMRPYLVRIEQAIRRDLIAPADRPRYYAEFLDEALLRTEALHQAQIMEINVRNGVWTRNEARRLQNMPRKDGGDSLTMQAQNIPIDAVPAAGDTAP